MNWDRIAGNWKQAKGKVKEQWGKLTDDELDQVAPVAVGLEELDRAGDVAAREGGGPGAEPGGRVGGLHAAILEATP